MATEKMMPKAFSFRTRTRDVLAVGIITLTGLGIAFTTLNSLDTIASFSSLTFLFVSLGVGIANYRLRAITKSNGTVIISGIVVVVVTIGLLLFYMGNHERDTLSAIGVLYGAVFAADLLFSKRRLILVSRNS